MIRRLTIGGIASARSQKINLSTTAPSYSFDFPPLSSENKLPSQVSSVKKSEVPKVHKPQKPDSAYFAQLKSEEHSQFAHRGRRRFTYTKNRSAALSLPYSKKELGTKETNPQALLAMSRKNVIEHANRRVDLFFYTLVAYYKTGIVPTNGHTDLQHGRGRTINGSQIITEACHSSFTPSLLDTSIYRDTSRREKQKSLLSGTHFFNSLNATVELPPFVNDLDDVLENMCRQKSMDILSDVSLGIKNPVEGLTLFLKMMNEALLSLKKGAHLEQDPKALSQHSFLKPRSINPKLLDFVTKGTLSTTYSTENQRAEDDYIQLLLRMTPEEKALWGKSNESGKEQIYLDKILEMQEEILETRANHRIG